MLTAKHTAYRGKHYNCHDLKIVHLLHSHSFEITQSFLHVCICAACGALRQLPRNANKHLPRTEPEPFGTELNHTTDLLSLLSLFSFVLKKEALEPSTTGVKGHTHSIWSCIHGSRCMGGGHMTVTLTRFPRAHRFKGVSKTRTDFHNRTKQKAALLS